MTAATDPPVLGTDDHDGPGPCPQKPADRHDLIEGGRVWRFDRVERVLHWTVAALVLVLLVTGSVLYIGPLSTLVGRRVLVKDLHVWSGLLLPVPWLFALPGARGRALRRDLGRLSRWYRDDTTWLRTRGHSGRNGRLRKFNAGQKVFTLVAGGALPVLLGTGLIMRWFEPFPDSIRTGATFVHDWTYVVLGVLVVGHILKALAEPEALRSMVTGWVPASWARVHRARWWSEAGGDGPP
jgi:formate dehydrogenase subunit gamma